MKGFFYGSATALITPFTETGVNFDALGAFFHKIAFSRSRAAFYNIYALNISEYLLVIADKAVYCISTCKI